MNSFYNIILVSRDASDNDSLAIGLIASGENKYYIQFSNRKLKLARSLIAENEDIVDYIQEQLTSKIDFLNETLKSDNRSLFNYDQLPGADYFSYLNRYCNNHLRFSRPYILNKPVDSEGFRSLFNLLIGDDPLPSDRNRDRSLSFNQNIRSKVIEPLRGKIHTELKITDKILPSIYFSFEFDCIGRNGIITAAKSVDFCRKEETIDLHLSHYFQVSSLLSLKYGTKANDNNYFLISDEPEISNKRAHDIWVKVRNMKQFRLVPSAESEIIAETVIKSGAREFLEP